jgi:lipoprotein-releasing system permease protein
MLGIEKKKDISVLYSMGATKNLIRKIFLYEGVIISFVGSFLGLAFGIGICLVQQKFGIVSMGMQTSIVQAYPVKIQTLDIVFIGVSIILITLLVSFSPARKASDVDLKSNL